MQECTYFSKKKTSISIDTIIKNEFSSVTHSKSFRGYTLKRSKNCLNLCTSKYIIRSSDIIVVQSSIPDWVKERKKKKKHQKRKAEKARGNAL